MDSIGKERQGSACGGRGKQNMTGKKRRFFAGPGTRKKKRRRFCLHKVVHQEKGGKRKGRQGERFTHSMERKRGKRKFLPAIERKRLRKKGAFLVEKGKKKSVMSMWGGRKH